MELDLENLDLSNIENIKQHIINNFTKYGLFLQKFRKTDGGIYVYHSRGMQHMRKVRKIIEENDFSRTYEVTRKFYGVDFIDTTDKETFKNYLTMSISEALRRLSIGE